MLDKDPKHLLTEIEAAEKERNRHLRNTQTLIKRFVGNWYRDDMRGKPVPENLIFTFVANILPQLVFDNPEVTVTAKRSITHRPIAQWMRHAINGWIKEVHARDELEAAALNMLFSYGILKVGLESRGDFNREAENGVMERFTMDALIPYMVSIDPEDFFIDVHCTSWATARLMGHQFQRDLDDLLEDERYDKQAVRLLSADNQDDHGGMKPTFRRPREAPDRGRVTLYEIWLPEYREIGVLSKTQGGDGVWLRGPTAYVGPEEGPYVPLGVYNVPRRPYPLSPIAALAEQFAELNAHAAAAAQEAASQKKLIIVDKNQSSTAGAVVHQAPTGSVVEIPGFNPQSAMTVELGGTSQARLQYIELMRQRVDRISGQSEALRGKAQNVTATEAKITASAADARMEFLHLKFRQGVKQALRRVGWYCFHNPAVVLPVSWHDEQTGETHEGLFLGGIQPGQETTDWSDFFLDIEPYSMRRVDPVLMAEQAHYILQTAINVAPLIPQFPWINWRSILDDIGEAHNIPDFAARVLNEAGMQLIAQGVMPGMLAGANPQVAMQLPPSANQNLIQGTAGAPVRLSMPAPRGGNMQQAVAALNPGVRAAMDLGYIRDAGGAAAAA